MQRPISVNVWYTDPYPLHCQHFEVNEERDRGQEEWTASTNGFGGTAYGLNVGNLDRPKPSVGSTPSGTSNVMAALTNAAAKFGQQQHVGNIQALNLTTASPITRWHEVEPSDDELDSLRSHKPRSRLQVLILRARTTARQRHREHVILDGSPIQRVTKTQTEGWIVLSESSLPPFE